MTKDTAAKNADNKTGQFSVTAKKEKFFEMKDTLEKNTVNARRRLQKKQVVTGNYYVIQRNKRRFDSSTYLQIVVI